MFLILYLANVKFLASALKALLPILASKTNSGNNELNLEKLIENSIIILINTIEMYNDNLNDY